jgi:hypothetical protein
MYLVVLQDEFCNFEVRHPRCVNQITKYTADAGSQNTSILYNSGR